MGASSHLSPVSRPYAYLNLALFALGLFAGMAAAFFIP